MLTASQLQVLRVAARWSLQQLELSEQTLAKLAYMPDTPANQALDVARDSISVFLPKMMQTIRQVQGERYGMNASESRGRIFYFFSPRHPVDSFNMTLWIQGDKAHIDFGFTPHKLNGQLDLQKAISERAVSEPEMAGLALMRLVRSVMATKARLKLGALQ